MDHFLLHMEQERTDTPVSNIFLDEYMPDANGAYIKIYLYLLRCIKSGTDALSVPAIADRFDLTENDVYRALGYWEKMALLRLEQNPKKGLTGICLLEPRHREPLSFPATPFSKEGTAPEPREEASIPPKKDYSAERLSKFQEQKEIRQLLFICEQYLGKPLSPSEISAILYFYDSLSFPAELIEYLIEYCVSKGHKSLHYIESVAIAWHKEGYQTAAQAKKECSLYTRAYFAVLGAFGIKGRSPVDAEIKYVDKWMKTLGFSLELVLEACSRTMSAIHQPSFEYADSILNSWHSQKASSLSDVAALDARRNTRTQKAPAGASAVKKAAASNRFHNFKQRDYNFAELEKKLINN